MLLPFLLIGRVRWLEPVFGLDRLSRVHGVNGFVVLALVLLHGSLMTVAYALQNEVGPLAQMLDDLGAAGKEAVLIYGNRREKDIVFREELEKTGARVVHVLSDEEGWPGEKGQIDLARVERLVPDFRERDIYICGPPPMMLALVKTLRGAGTPPDHIHYERFAL